MRFVMIDGHLVNVGSVALVAPESDGGARIFFQGVNTALSTSDVLFHEVRQLLEECAD